MYINKTTGFVISTHGDSYTFSKEKRSTHAHSVFKTARILMMTEYQSGHIRKSMDIADLSNQGASYYQVLGNQGACEKCAEHDGAIYPISEAQEGVNLPPFHPNCKCTIANFSTKNPNDDPWQAEALLWLDIMYGNGTMEEKAQRVIDFYQWTDFSTKLIADILSAVESIGHMGKRMEEFFCLLSVGEINHSENSNADNVFQLPKVHFEGKTYPLLPLRVSLPSEWTDYAHSLGNILNVDYHLVIAFILHESGGNPLALNTMHASPMQQATGLMQIIPYWHSAYQEGGQYYNNYPDVITYAKQNGADINNLFDPLGNITVGMMMLNEQRKLCKHPGNMREWVGRQGEGYQSASTLEILYYRDFLAMQDGMEVWYPATYYSSRMIT